MTPGRWIMLISLLLVGGVAALFTVQNLNRMSGLSLDLFFVGFELKDALPVPYLLGGAFGVGLLMGILLMVPALFRGSSSGGAGADATAGEAWT